MRKYLILAFATTLFATAGAAQATSIHIKPGEWESTITTKIEGVPMLSGAHSFTNKDCVTKKDTEFKPPHDKTMQCSYKMLPRGAHKMALRVSCKNVKNGMEYHGKGETSYSSTHTKGYMNIKMTGMPGIGSATMHETWETHRIGSCKS